MDHSAQKNVLVTGGAGFIGSHVVDRYLAAGHRVTVIDNLSAGKRSQIHPDATFVEGDIRDRSFVEQTIKTYGPFDAINHHAAQKSIGRSIDDPHEDADINILGTLALLEAARAEHIPQFIFASSGGAIYGSAAPLPTPESSIPQAETPYGIAKATIELYLRFYQTIGLRTLSLRYANVYGPRQDPAGEAGVIAIFVNQAITQKNLTILGTGRQTRDFVFVGDIAEANLIALEYAASGAWNIATGTETSISEVAKTVLTKAGRSITTDSLSFLPSRPGDQERSCLDPRAAARELGFQTTTPLASGLEATVAFFRR